MGRDDELKALHEQLQQGTTVAISAIAGMGGIGKTELAWQYADRQRQTETYRGGICWLEAREELGTQIVLFARSCMKLDVPLDREIQEQVRWCWQNWDVGDVLIVLDDVQDYQDVEPFLPHYEPRFKVLLTTRLQLQEDRVRLIHLDQLAPLEAFQLLYEIGLSESLTSADQQIAEDLCEWLGYLPLGIKLVANFLKVEPDLSLQALFEQLKAEKLRQDSLMSIEAVFQLSWEKLTIAEQQLSALISVFAIAAFEWRLVEDVVQLCRVEPVPQGFLKRLLSWGSRSQEPTQWCLLLEPKELKRRRRRLIELSLLDHVGVGLYQLHPLIREFFAMKREQTSESADFKRSFCKVMAREGQKISRQPTLAVLQAVLPAIPHLKEAATTLTPWLSDDDLIEPTTRIAWFNEGQSAFAEAEQWLEQCRAIAEQRLGDDHPDVATSLDNLANLYCSQGRYPEAEPLFLQALEIGQRQLGDDHPDVATSLNNLALLYNSQGRYAEAEPLFFQALEIWQRQLGDDHPLVATSLNNLAGLYNSQGRYAEAEPLYLQALEIWQRQLGDDHPSVATSLNNLALLYSSQGRYAEAEPLYLQALEIWQRQLGDDYPLVATSLNNLALLYHSQGRYAEAEPLYLQALEIWQRQLGDDHPSVATSLNNLAALYHSQGRYAEVELLFRQALAISLQTLGETHPNTKRCWRNFLLFLQQVIQENRSDELSDNPRTRSLLQQLQDASD